jgi:hypothetical protein
MIESEAGIDIRKKLFYQLVERNWPLIGMESLGMSLEDIFISVVDHSEEKKTLAATRERTARKARRGLAANQEKELGAALYADAERQRAEAAKIADEDDE